MTDQEQRIAIAEAIGWTDVREEIEPILQFERLVGLPPKQKVVRILVPHFTKDLNAMHEAEAHLCSQDNPIMSNPQPSDRYEYWLCMVVLKRSQWDNGCWRGERNDTITIARATAAQRAEAFLRTIAKWK